MHYYITHFSRSSVLLNVCLVFDFFERLGVARMYNLFKYSFYHKKLSEAYILQENISRLAYIHVASCTLI